jgi:predicted RNA binding protein YcfA (HicA-like mRNA interferase family)
MKAISGKELCRILKRHGWTHVRTRSSHFTFEKPGCVSITVPVHGNKTLKTGIQHALMKAAGLTKDDL